MKNRHAFTLTEVLVVLSILALVAILSYNFFGGTMRDAAAVQGATKAYNDMRVISDALDLFELKTGAPLAGSSLAPLVDGGYLKSLPTMTSSMALNPAVAGYIYDSAMSDLDVDGDDDSYIATENVTMDICKAFNDMLPSFVKTDIWRELMESLSAKLKFPVVCEEAVFGKLSFFQELRNRKTNMSELAEIALAASDDIEAGFDIEDVIMRCYVQMMGVVKRRRGLNRKEAMTPSEFAYWLEGAGLPGGPLQRLTRLFERVRYGAYRSSNEEAHEAADCLREIAIFCGEGHS